MSGIQRTTLGSYASGRSRPSVEAINALARALPTNERAKLVLAHLQDECPAAARPYIKLELRSAEDAAPVPVAELDVALVAIRAAALRDPETAEWLKLTASLLT